MSCQADNLAHSLERIAQSFEQDADALRAFARQVRANKDTDYANSALHSNVVALVARTMNNSSWISAAESALHNASELVRGGDR